MLSMKKICLSIVLTTALAVMAACGSGADSCSSDADCLAGQYCATGGGVFFQNSQCLNRSAVSNENSPDSEQDDAAQSPGNQDIIEHNADDVEESDVEESDAEEQDALQPDTDLPDLGTPTGTQCVETADCQPTYRSIPVEISPCAFEETCSNSGSKIVEEQIYHCFEGLCYQKTEQQTKTCERDTTDNACGDLNPAIVWGECEYENECSTSGVVYGTTTNNYCENGTCSRQESFGVGNNTRCDRITNGFPCVNSLGQASTCKLGICTHKKAPQDPLDPIEL